MTMRRSLNSNSEMGIALQLSTRVAPLCRFSVQHHWRPPSSLAVLTGLFRFRSGARHLRLCRRPLSYHPTPPEGIAFQRRTILTRKACLMQWANGPGRDSGYLQEHLNGVADDLWSRSP